MNLANKITLVRIVLTPAAIVSILFWNIYSTLAILIVAFLSDIVDGYVARKRKEVTKLGVVLDSIADKFLITAVMLALFIKYGLTLWYLPLLLAREIVISVTSTALVSRKLRKKVDLSSVWAGKLTTMLQGIVIIILIFGYEKIFPFVLATAVMGILSSAIYLSRAAKAPIV